MDQETSFLRAGERAHRSARALLEADLHESAAFYACHAFELMGSAFFLRAGENYIEGHTRRANLIKHVAGRAGIGHSVSVVAALVIRMRSASLYPGREPPHRPPERRLSASDARDLVSRVEGVMRAMRGQM